MNKEELEAQREKALKEFDEWHQNGYFMVNDNKYEIKSLTHETRLKVLAFFSHNEQNLILGNYSFVTSAEFQNIMKLINDRVIFDDMQISKNSDHFEKNHPEDYLDYIHISMKMVCYPFYKKKSHMNFIEQQSSQITSKNM